MEATITVLAAGMIMLYMAFAGLAVGLIVLGSCVGLFGGVTCLLHDIGTRIARIRHSGSAAQIKQPA